jgi:hypothetical protein
LANAIKSIYAASAVFYVFHPSLYIRNIYYQTHNFSFAPPPPS